MQCQAEIASLARRRAAPGVRARDAVRGDAAILYTFFTLLIIALGGMTIAMLVTSTVRQTRDITDSAQAFYVAGSAIERGRYDYNWNHVCTTVPEPGDLFRTDDSSIRYTLAVKRLNSDGSAQNDCSTQIGAGFFCSRATGKVKNGTILRRAVDNVDQPPPNELCPQ
jgi:Tfp pilus assembly protein PilX